MALGTHAAACLFSANRVVMDYAGLPYRVKLKTRTRTFNPERISQSLKNFLADMAAGESSEDECACGGLTALSLGFWFATALFATIQATSLSGMVVCIDIEEPQKGGEALRSPESDSAITAQWK